MLGTAPEALHRLLLLHWRLIIEHNGQSGPNPFLGAASPPKFLECRGTVSPVDPDSGAKSISNSGGLGKYAEMTDRPPMESSLAALWFVSA